MPVYNAEKYLFEAVESILNQTYKDFQFLIINDGSTDKSVEIIQSFEDSRICLVHNEKNIGLTPTLNKGIDLAEGKYIARMDSDDISHPTRLEEQLKLMEKHPDYAMVSTWADTISEDGQFVRVNEKFHSHSYYNLVFENNIWHPSVFCKKEVFLALGKYPASYAEDFALWSKMVKNYKVFKIDKSLISYRRSATSLSHVVFSDECAEDANLIVSDNIRYYLGDDVSIPPAFLACYVGDYGPLLAKNDAREVVSCLEFLEQIDEAIIKKKNVNRNISHIKEAARLKRNKIIQDLNKKDLDVYQKLKLLLQTRSYGTLTKSILSKLKVK